jgi:hypothetical protein
MNARAIFERTKRRFKRSRSHIGCKIFLGYVVLGPAFLLLTLVMPELFAGAYETFAWGFAILGIFAAVMLTAAAIAAAREEP